ncbi:hypothetical protein [Staphylococcus warneri]|uniref:hypothetical protein n=1 Tax=Staphylococcus warneri TaxID=1292 RepID=UPI001F59F5FA|nr:hypothetical protein [Staphylococcus warneri]MCI2766223.1 hypothetical protein [Staphylococcus warneri]MCI2787271.1 hypothetical protein [Staphylococcus warneri]
MIIVKSNREEIFDFNYWLEHNLTLYDIERILNTQSIDKEQQKFKIEYQKLQLIEEEKELWFSLKEAAYILNGNSFLIYAESDEKDKRNVSADYVKNKSNDILNNIDELLSERKEDYIKQFGTKGLESYLQSIKPQKKSFSLSKMKHINAQMIDEILRVNISRSEEIKFRNIKTEDVLPSKEEITKYINYDSCLKNNDSVIEYLNKISTELGKALSDISNFLNKISFLKTIVKEVREDVQNIHSNFGIGIQAKYESIKNEYIKLLKMCQKISNDYVDILDIEYIFSTYADVNIIFNGSDDANIINISYINNEQHITKNFKNFIDSRKKQYLMDIDWSKHYIYKNLNKIEENPTTFLNGTMEITRISDWMYRNKTKVAYQIINKNFNDAYDLLNGMLKNEYSNLIRLLRSYYDWKQRL